MIGDGDGSTKRVDVDLTWKARNRTARYSRQLWFRVEGPSPWNGTRKARSKNQLERNEDRKVTNGSRGQKTTQQTQTVSRRRQV